jgi:hypothetical protein
MSFTIFGFASPRDVKFIAQLCVERSNGKLDKLIDPRIYSYTAIKQLRMPYSNKYDECGQEETHMTCHPLLKDPTVPMEPFDRPSFVQSIIGTWEDLENPPKIYTVVDATTIAKCVGDPNRQILFDTLDSEQMQTVKQHTDAFRRWLTINKKAGNQRIPRYEHDSLLWRVDNIFCEVIGRDHSSNGALVRLYFNRNGEACGALLNCSDCEAYWKPEVPIDFICMPEKIEALYLEALEETMAEMTISPPYLEEDSVSSDT